MDENMSNISDISGGTTGSGAFDSNADISSGGLFTASPGEGMNNYSETASGNGLLTQSIMNNSDKTGDSAYPAQFSPSQTGLLMSDNELIKPDPDVLPEPQAMPSYENSTLGKFSDAGLKENLSLLNAGALPNNSSTGFPGLSPETASIFRSSAPENNRLSLMKDGNMEYFHVHPDLNNMLNSSKENIYAFEYCFNNLNEDKLRQSKSNANAEKYFPMKTDIYKYAAGKPVNSSYSSEQETSPAKDCFKVFCDCMINYLGLSDISTLITEGSKAAGDYYTLKAFAHAAGRNLIYPKKSSIYRKFLGLGDKLPAWGIMANIIYGEYNCLQEEMKCVNNQ